MVLLVMDIPMCCYVITALQEGLSKVHFTADRSSHASALYSAEEQAKQAKKKVKQCPLCAIIIYSY